jgi:hypothetical protein
MDSPFKHLEIECNTACDLACFACDRFSDATTAPNMTLEQVAMCVDESLELGWEWERIRLLGGEPTLHPQFEELLAELMRYRLHFPNVFLQVLTNGRGKAKQRAEFCQRNGVSLHAEAKDGTTPAWFTNTRIAPVDRFPDVGEVEPCGIFGTRGCGIGLTRHGYFLDGAGASIARVAGYDVGVMRLKDVTWDAMLAQARVLCRVCGHWYPEGKRPPPVTATGEVTGRFWTETLAKYSKEKPKLRVYGGGG